MTLTRMPAACGFSTSSPPRPKMNGSHRPWAYHVLAFECGGDHGAFMVASHFEVHDAGLAHNVLGMRGLPAISTTSR